MNNTWGLHPFFTAFWHYDRRATLKTLGLNLAGALLEGLGLILLLPLLHLAGVVSSHGTPALPGFIPAPVSVWLNSMAPPQRLLLMLGIFVSLIILQSVVALLRERQSLQLRLRFVDHLRSELFGSLARSRWSFLSRHHSSEFLSVLTTDVGRVGFGVLYLLQLFTQLAVFPVYLGVAFHLSPPVTGIAALTGAVLWWTLRKSRTTAKQGGLVLSQANQGLFKEIQEFLGALKLIKIHGEDAGYRHQFNHVLEHLREQQSQFQLINGRSQAVFRIGGAFALAMLAYVSLVWVQLPGARLLVLIAIFSRMLPQVSGIHMSLQQLWQMAPAFDNWHRWLLACQAEAEPDQIGSQSTALQIGIQLKDVSYRHPHGNQILHALDLFIPAHCTTAIVGATGSGKTTLLDLLSGLNMPDAGTIKADGVDLHTHIGWQRQIAYIPQETVILDGTVRENLTWGATRPDEASLMKALDQAAAADFIRQLPHGLDTWVGERGVRLSGGEKQRLALARALLRNPELLILDESTNALDREHQQTIFEALKILHGQMTVLVVTHRLEEIRDLVDGLVHVKAGQIGPWTQNLR
jgi:ATP-binding cassette subfamily C protein